MAKAKTKTIDQMVADWNETYKDIGSQIRDLHPASYEAEVGAYLLDCADDDVDNAIAVFRHKDNKGGWMVGDVVAWLERQRPDAVTITMTATNKETLASVIMEVLRSQKGDGVAEADCSELISAANAIGCNIDWATLDPAGF